MYSNANKHALHSNAIKKIVARNNAQQQRSIELNSKPIKQSSKHASNAINKSDIQRHLNFKKKKRRGEELKEK